MALRRLCRSWFDRAEIGLVRCLPAERLMRTPPIVPVEEFNETALLLKPVGRRAQIDPLVLHRPPKPLDEDIVMAASAAIHADLDPMIQQHTRERLAGELRTLVAIEDAGPAELGKSLAECLDAEPRRQGVRQTPRQNPPGRPVDDRDQIQKPSAHRDVRNVARPHLVRLVDRLVAQQVGVDLVLGMRLAGVPLRPDGGKTQLAHQPSDAPTPDRNPLAQQRHLQSPAAIHRMLGEHSIEPVQQIEILRGRRPGMVIEAAARDPEQRALPAHGQPRVRRDHRPPLSSREMAGCPARKSRSTCNWPILRCRSSMTFCASSTVGALLPRTNSSLARFISSCFQVLIIVGWTPNSDDRSARVFSPDSAAIATRALKSALCCFLFAPTSHASLDRSALSLSDCPENRSRRKETRYYISSAILDAERAGQAIRGHWGIENRLHWVLDVTFADDQSRLRKGFGARNMAVVRHFALNLVRAAKDTKSIKLRRKIAGWTPAYLDQILNERVA